MVTKRLAALAALLLVAAGILLPGRPAAAATPFRVVTFNVCGGYYDGCMYHPADVADSRAWVTRLKTQILYEGTRQPDVVMLQELCATQRDLIKEQLTGYTVAWTSFRDDHYACDKWNPGSTQVDRKAFGTAILIRGTIGQPVLQQTLTAAYPEGDDIRKLLCVVAPVGGRDTLVCNAHTSASLADEGAPQIAAQIQQWAQGRPVLFGGDLNADPFDPNLNAYYGIEGGSGPFTEAGQADRQYFDPRCTGLLTCRTGAPTTITDPRKFDYLFGTSGVISWTASQTLTPVPGTLTGALDHRGLRGDAVWADDVLPPSTPYAEPASIGAGSFGTVDSFGWIGVRDAAVGGFTGDDRPDLVVRRWDGQVLAYPNQGGGRLGAPVTLKTAAQGWATANEMLAADLTGDGRDDLVLRQSSGTVQLYPGGGDTGVVLKSAGYFSDARDIAVGDLTGDRTADLVVQWNAGSVFIYPGDGAGGLGDSRVLRTAGFLSAATPTGMTVGDVDHDGNDDLIARRTDGSLVAYPGNGAGDVGAEIVLQAAPAQASTRPVTELVGDLSGDGADDLIARWAGDNDRRLRIHPAPATAIDPAGGTVVTAATHGTGLFAATRIAAGDLTGDGYDDLLVRWRWGTANLYAGHGDGTLTGGGQVGTAGAWSNARDVVIGDYDADGRNDVVVRWADGSVVRFPGDGKGGIGAGTALRPAGGWSDAVEMVGGDVDNDGHDDLLVRWTAGSVYLYPGLATGGLGATVVLRTAAAGWSDALSMSVGDFAGDSRNDILVRWRAGSAFAYPGNAQGGIDGSVVYRPAGAFTDAGTVLTGNFAGNPADVLVKWSDGSARIHPAGATAGDPVTVRSSDAGSGVDHFEYTTAGTGTPISVPAVQGSAGLPGAATNVLAVDGRGNRSAP